ncbi:hypothetical protein IG7_05661 [Bacillus cereus HuA2-4]|nr:hypothetical protein IG7_05661 [Bacillus cereus HuA2-4]
MGAIIKGAAKVLGKGAATGGVIYGLEKLFR